MSDRTQDAHDAYAALRNPGYRWLLAGNLLASIGTEMQRVAIGWEVYHRTSDALNLGLVGLVLYVPFVSFALPAGHWADRHNRRRMLQIGQGLAALAALGLAAISFSEGPILLIYVCLFVAGISRSLSAPARWAFLSQVVPDEQLGNAITWNSSAWQLASMSGPALGGLAISLTGHAGWTYLIIASFATACAGFLAFIQPMPRARSTEPLSLESLSAGIRYIWNAKLILATITLDLFAVLLGGATALLPMFAKDILSVGPLELGLMQAAPAAGALIMAILMAHRPPLKRAGRALLWSVGGFGAATIGFGLSENFYLSVLMLMLTGAFDNVSVVIRGTLVQVLTPNEMRGRVSSVNSIFIFSSNELGAFESGLTAKWFGPIWSVVGGGIGTLLVVAGVMLKWPQVLALGSLREVREEQKETGNVQTLG
jgi:MFS family permease